MKHWLALHDAKGLEFDSVLLSGWEEVSFPTNVCLRSLARTVCLAYGRLAHVGLTRARRRVVISHASADRRDLAEWHPSQPLHQELPDVNVELTGTAALARDAQMLAARKLLTASLWWRGGRVRSSPGSNRHVLRHTYLFTDVQLGNRLRHREGGRGRPVRCGV